MVRKNILIIAPHIPKFDTNAGDWRVYCLVKELSKKYNVYFLPLVFSKTKYKDILEKFVVKILKLPKTVSSFKATLEKLDIRTAIFEKYFAVDYLKIIKYSACIENFIIDTHDINYLKHQRLDDASSKYTGHLKNKAQEISFYKTANALIAISENDKNIIAREINKKILVVPTCCENLKTENKSFKDRKDICFFAFWEYPPNIDGLKYFINDIYPSILKSLPDVKLHVLGYGADKILSSFKNIAVKNNIKNIQSELSKYKVFICPLRYGSGIKKKVLDAMSAKTPVVTTSVGAEGIDLKNVKIAFDSSRKFADEVVKLYNNSKYWRVHSIKNYKNFNAKYTMRQFGKYIKKLDGVII